MRAVYAPFWIRASSGGASGSLQLTGLLVTGCSTFGFPSVAAPAAKITPLNQTKTVALPTSALLSPAAQSPVQVGRKKPTLLNQNQNLEQKVRRHSSTPLCFIFLQFILPLLIHSLAFQ